MKCLASWLEATADAGYVNNRLRPFVAAFRQVPTLNNDQRRSDVTRSFVRSTVIIAEEVETFAAPPAVEKACLPLIRTFCPAFVNSADQIADRSGLMTCLGSFNQSLVEETSASDISKKLGQFVADEGWETRPYFAIAHASLMAQLGEYTAAANILDDWLKRLTARSGRRLKSHARLVRGSCAIDVGCLFRGVAVKAWRFRGHGASGGALEQPRQAASCAGRTGGETALPCGEQSRCRARQDHRVRGTWPMHNRQADLPGLSSGDSYSARTSPWS